LIGDPANEDSLKRLFSYIMKRFKEYKIFKTSPTFFVVYAWENPKEPGCLANAKIVEEFINWCENVGYEFYSDQTEPGESRVTDGQLRLLPWKACPEYSVERVLLCGSNLLGKYMKDPQFNTYVDSVASAYNEAQRERKKEDHIHEVVRNVQRQHCHKMGDKFHHIQTEIALLKTRVKTRVGETVGGAVEPDERGSIIPFLLNGKHQDNFPEFITDGMDNLLVELGRDGSKYQCFLELLEKLAKREYAPE
jgi:hypothetical protein